MKLGISALVLLYCSISSAEESSNIICDKGIFPSSAPQKEGVIPLTEESDDEGGDTTPKKNTDESSQAQPQSDQTQEKPKQPNTNNTKSNCGR